MLPLVRDHRPLSKAARYSSRFLRRVLAFSLSGKMALVCAWGFFFTTSLLANNDFLQRNDEVALRRLAGSLQLKLGKPADPRMAEVVAAYRAEDALRALALLGDRFRDKLFYPSRFHLPSEITDPTVGYNQSFVALEDSPAVRKKIIPLADALLEGRIPVVKTFVSIGEPGEVQWNRAPSPAETSEQGTPAMYWGFTVFDPLIHAYFLTGERRYLERWTAYSDDWALYEDHFERTWPLGMKPEEAKGAARTWAILKGWGAVAARLKENPEAFPIFSWLRVINKLLPAYPLSTVAYHRGIPRNWTIENAYFYVSQGLFFEEFAVGPELFREGMRVMESYATTHNMPDGTENQQMLGYNLMYLKDTGHSLRLLKAARKFRPHGNGEIDQWLSRPYWEEIVTEHRRERAVRLLRMTTTDGRGPIGLRTDRRPMPVSAIVEAFPEIGDDPESARIIAWLDPKGDPRTPPQVRAETFPYGGYTWIRESWDKQAAQAFMFCSPQPGALAGFLSERNNNAVSLQAFGEDLLVAGERGAYSRRPSPLRVDGLEQAFHLGQGAPPPAWNNTDRHRFHDSSDFALIEGSYAGPYGVRPADLADASANAEAYARAVRDVEHRRVLIYLRSLKIWVVADRLSSAVSHDYTLEWRLPLAPSGDRSYRPFLPREIALQSESGMSRLVTSKPDGANLALTLFTPPGARVSSDEELRGGTPVSDFLRLDSSWKSDSGRIAITLLQPFLGNGFPRDKLRSLGDRAVKGFFGVMESGAQIHFGIGESAIEQEAFATLKVTGELLVATRSPRGRVTGIVLGCSEMKWGQKNVSYSRGADFEFTREVSGEWKFSPINRPIPQVKIEPARALYGRGEPIELSCSEPETTIHYTLDGSPVTPQSPRYVKPIAFEGTRWLRARAFRRGVTELPQTHSYEIGRAHV